MLWLTDGFQTVQAMEHEKQPGLPDAITPGCKVELRGPLVCRRGIVLLRTNCLRLGFPLAFPFAFPFSFSFCLSL